MVIIGHRGAMGYEPENTLRSFERAISFGVAMIEFDVYALKDGSLVVIHDLKVDRTTNGTGYVIDKTLEEIKMLDAGSGEKIPTLQETLNSINKRVGVNIELKGENTAALVAEVLKEYVENKGWSYEDFLVSSFNHPELQIFKRLMPEIKIGALTSIIPLDYAKYAEPLQAFAIHPAIDFVNKAFVDDAHQRGFKVYVYTVNEADDYAHMKQIGVDGVFTNNPDKLEPTRHKPALSQSSPTENITEESLHN